MKPGVPMVLGSGPLTDEMRRMIEADPDRYRPVTMSRRPVGVCPCCGAEVFSVTSRLTDWEQGYATGPGEDDLLHPIIDGRTGCCCFDGAWGPKHAGQKTEGES